MYLDRTNWIFLPNGQIGANAVARIFRVAKNPEADEARIECAVVGCQNSNLIETDLQVPAFGDEGKHLQLPRRGEPKPFEDL